MTTPFVRAHLAWQASDLSAFLDLLHDDILYLVNVDGITVPYASSAVGKEDVRFRLQYLLDTFQVDEFSLEGLEQTTDYGRSRIKGSYLHKQTGERLDVKITFIGWIRDGLLYRIEERHDAAYVVAFERFVRYLDRSAGWPDG
ncbi:MAG: nuclear transport factor 2 family protein [Hyphomicrobiaceae bacterium]|nr:nuclear transport factor 2 family protein [Hyphomicrobiaceae bacterium]